VLSRVTSLSVSVIGCSAIKLLAPTLSDVRLPPRRVVRGAGLFESALRELFLSLLNEKSFYQQLAASVLDWCAGGLLSSILMEVADSHLPHGVTSIVC
jgi:hypothetical protein